MQDISRLARAARIRALNDAFRAPALTLRGWLLTAGVEAKGPEFIHAAIAAVQAYDRFDEDSDPNGEHDFGSLELEGETIFWKIDYYDLELRLGSPDPADPEKTRRLLTLMLASDY